ncbi:type IV secretion protein DotU [Psychromonas sp. psych-6C06]|uniref:type IVB secretion system protein IcmH/DotU n=1 Tax=Psychromonas sp. psych-6C06 TaxID=2058089 RepID=UPI000C324C49|nr:type IVB secretion system protein IcmH/DotU [Psychromonas sp. psych-6C06]PKF63493.1 type IV secretion protein DotU [Psychromonas sp. psych-6C06]
MSAPDNADKTVFRQPINRGDGTVVRPMPGGRAVAGQPAPAAPAYQPQAAVPRENIPRDLSALNGLNPLVNAASTLLAVFSKTRDALNHPNVGGLHQQLDREIKNFEIKARSEGVKEDNVVVARYLICTILDEAVLNTPWGAESAWNQRTLLSVFHNETAGGEKFFAIIDRLRSNPAENIDVLELAYICLSLGYEGKFRVVSRGREHLEQLRDDLFHIIRTYRGEYERALSPRWQGIGNTRRTLANYIPMWVVASIVAGMLALTYTGFRYWLDQSSAVVSQEFVDVQSQLIPEKKDTSLSK